MSLDVSSWWFQPRLNSGPGTTWAKDLQDFEAAPAFVSALVVFFSPRGFILEMVIL